jgi:AraC family transcriptional regulator
MEPKVIDKKEMHLVGCVFYGDPFHTAEEWSFENEIGKTWSRFEKQFKKNQSLLKKYIVNPGIAYEVHIAPEEERGSKNLYIFVGIEVENLNVMPLEMFAKTLPATKYAVFTLKGENIFSGGQYIYREWLPNSGYQEAYRFLIQAYDEKRFKGLDDENSEIDFYIPIT